MKSLVRMILISVIFYASDVQCQDESSLAISIVAGPQRTYSHLIDYRSAPNKISGAWNHYEGISLSYQHPRFPISFSTGIGISHLSNNFTFKSFPRHPVFSRDADIPTEKISYKVIEVPVNLHYQIYNSGKFRLNTLFGMSYLTEAFAYIPRDHLHYSTHIADIRTDWTVDWYYYYIHANNSSFTLNSGMKLYYAFNDKLEISSSIFYQMGLVPILTQLVIYEIIADNGNGSTLGAAYITSKGDAIKFLIGVDYKIPLKKTN